nr:MAG TPA: hypothetical protein [Bacteriophage sp.]
MVLSGFRHFLNGFSCDFRLRAKENCNKTLERRCLSKYRVTGKRKCNYRVSDGKPCKSDGK